MKVLLVNPASAMWTSRRHIHMGLGYLAGSLRAAGHDVTLFDGEVERESLDVRLSREPFELVGISSPTPLIYAAWEAAGVARKHGAITILGGPHLTLMPAESMQQATVDLVVRGEAEETILEIVDALAADPGELAGGPDGPRIFRAAAWAGILGLSYRDGDGRIVHNSQRPLNPHVDDIPWPAYDLFKIERYTNLQPLTDGLDAHARAFTIVTSRGCPYQCIYCSKPITGHTWRARKPAEVVKEWAYLVREMRATEIGVTDDVWNLDIKRAKELCRLLIAEELTHVPWVTVHGMRADNTDRELFDLMKRAGCKRVGFGVESGSQRVLDYIKKKQSVEDVRQAFANARAAGLQTMGFFIFGLPTETAETMDETIDLALELDPDLGNFMIAAPYPGTELYDIVRAEGHLFSDDWRDFAIHDEKARYEIGDLTADLVEQKWHEAYRRFYMRPGRIWKKVWRGDTWRQLPTYVSNFLRFFIGRSRPKDQTKDADHRAA